MQVLSGHNGTVSTILALILSEIIFVFGLNFFEAIKIKLSVKALILVGRKLIGSF